MWAMRHVMTVAVAFSILVTATQYAVADLKIGTVLSIAGPASFLGDPEKRTLQIYVAEINANGGVNGQKLQLIIYDDGGNANSARTFATRLVEEEKVVAVVGGSTTDTTMAMIPVFEDAQIPFISLAGSVQIIQPVRKWVFKTPATDTMACEKIFVDLKHRELARIALISGSDAFGKSMSTECHKVAGQYGIKIIVEETYGPRDSDVTPQLTKIRDTPGVQAVVNPGFGLGPAIVTRNYRQLGIKQPLYESHGVCSKSYIRLAGPAAEGVRLPCSALLITDKLPNTDAQKPVLVDYARTFEQKTGQPVSTFGGHAYNGLMILVDAMERAKSSDPAKVRDAIEKTKGYVGTDGIVNMSPNDHLGLNLSSAFHMLEIKHGDWTLVPGP